MSFHRVFSLLAVFGLVLALYPRDGVAQDQDFDQFSAAIDSSSEHVEALQTLDTLATENIVVVDTGDLTPQEEVAGLVETAHSDPDGLALLRGALGEREVVAGVLEENEHTADDVVAVHVSDDGHVTLYTHSQ